MERLTLQTEAGLLLSSKTTRAVPLVRMWVDVGSPAVLATSAENGAHPGCCTGHAPASPAFLGNMRFLGHQLLGAAAARVRTEHSYKTRNPIRYSINSTPCLSQAYSGPELCLSRAIRADDRGARVL